MQHFEELYPGRFLKGVTLVQPKTVRVKKILSEVLESGFEDEGPKTNKPKVILHFLAKEGPGEMVLCKTNAALIAAMFGPYHASWIDHLVTFHFDPTVPFNKEKVGGIRVAGSPELKETKRVAIKRPRRKKPEIYELRPTQVARQTEAETPSGRFVRLLASAPDAAAVDRIMGDVEATLTGNDLKSAQEFANVRRAALASREP